MTQPRIRIVPIIPKGGADFDIEAARQELSRLLRKAGADGQRFIARYPAQRLVASGYRRTGTLKRSWSNTFSSGAREVSVRVGSNSNIAPYNNFVQGASPVAIFKSAGWKNVDDLEDFMQDRVDDEAQEIIDRHSR